MPPLLALNLKVKYPDIYNRYRKLKGPIKASRQYKGKGQVKSEGQHNDDYSPIPQNSDVNVLLTEETDEVDDQFQVGSADMEGMNPQISEDLARLTSQGQVDLAQALLQLPRGDQDGDGVHLNETMLEMTQGDKTNTWI